MKKLVLFIVAFIMLFTVISYADFITDKSPFYLNGDDWTRMTEREKQLTVRIYIMSTEYFVRMLLNTEGIPAELIENHIFLYFESEEMFESISKFYMITKNRSVPIFLVFYNEEVVKYVMDKREEAFKEMMEIE